MTNFATEESDGVPEPAAGAADVRPVPRISIQAFCESPDLIATIETAANDRRMSRAHVSVHGGTIATANEFYQSTATPNLIILESKLIGDALDAALDGFAEVCDANTNVIVVGHINDVDIYRSLSNRGISEYLVIPVGEMGLIRAISALYTDRTSPFGRAIAFVGGKGGVGSSTVAHNVGWAIASSFDGDVMVADLDLAFGTAGLDFNQDPTQGIAEAVGAPDRLDDVFLNRLLSRCSDHLSLLAAPATLDKIYDLDEAAFEKIIDVAQTGVPAVVLDVPHLWTSWAKKTLFSADEIVLTVEPDLANLRNAKNIVDLLRQSRPADVPPRLIINKVGIAKRPEIDVSDFCAGLDLQADAIIPFDAQLFGTAANNGQMIEEADPKSAISDSFSHIAHLVTGREQVKRQKRGKLAQLMASVRGAKST
jgi:pilus assembly protein CpaE